MDRHLCLSMTWSILSLIHVNVSWLKCETADNVIKGKSYTNRIVYTNSPPLHNQQEREDIIIISCLIITKVTGEKIQHVSSITGEVARLMFDHLLCML